MMELIASFKLAFFILKSIRKEGEAVDVIYATLIIRGLKTYKEVPAIIKPRVKKVLEGLDLGELAVEE